MNEKIKKNSNILKDSTNPLNKENEIENKNISNSNSQIGSMDSGKSLKEKSDIMEIPLKNNYFDDDNKKTSLSDGNNNSDSSLKTKSLENINFNSLFKDNNNAVITKKEKYKLEQKMKNELKKNYKEIEINKNSLKKNNLHKNNLNNNSNSIKNNYSPKVINEINKSKRQIMKKLIRIQIFLIFLVPFNIILFYILGNIKNIKNFDLYISSVSLSSVLCGFTLFLIILIFLGIFQHYYTANIFRFLCLINFGISISLLIIQIILIFNFISNININNEKKLTKILIYCLIISITGISILINLLIGIIAKDSLLIIGGCKNENACPERKVKIKGSKIKENYVYFDEEIDKCDTNINALRKFHACIYSNNN